MEISFVKFSPTQNVTILVESAVPREMQAGVAAKLLAYDGVGGEQVGFLEPPCRAGAKMRLQMMGGEFCGNATMSLGVYLARREGIEGAAEYALEVSGAEELIPCRVERREDGWLGTVQMPLPERFDVARLDTDAGAREVPMVVMPGIVHLIVPANGDFSRGEIERRIRAWNERIGADALGVLRYDEATRSMEPIVYVPSTDSAVWERGCGSGTAALTCWKAHETGKTFCAAVAQPGGSIEARAEACGDKIAELTISGRVRVVAQGIAYV